MKIDIEKDVETNISNTVEFKAGSNARKLFRMLSDFLYSQKEFCVLHEISANAYDAHKISGKENVPIKVTPPSKLESKLRIRDFGPGLSESDVTKFLTTYGESSKSESNDVIGGWGIGSKSPAAVTDTWQIVSHHDGICKDYLVFINSAGIPSLTKIREFPTTESGIEVIIPVKPDRINLWTSHIPLVYKYYPVKPEFDDNSILKQFTNFNNPLFSGKDWKYYGNYGSSKFISSFREYVPASGQISKELIDPKYYSLLNSSIYIFFDIGEIELSISREQIQYSQFTMEAIKKKLDRIYDELKAEFDKFVNSATDGLEYRQLLLNLRNSKFSSDLLKSFIRGNSYNVTDIHDLSYFDVPLPKGFDLDSFKVSNTETVNALTGSFTCYKTGAISLRTYQSDIRFRINYLDKLVIVYDDCTMVGARVKNQKYGLYYLITKDLTWIPSELQKYIIKGSSLELPVRTSRQKTISDKNRVKSEYYSYTGSQFLKTDITPDVNKTAFMLVKDGRSLHWMSREELSLCNFLQSLTYKVIGIKNTKDLPKGGKYLYHFALDLISEFEKDPGLKRQYVYNEYMQYLEKKYSYYVRENNKILNYFFAKDIVKTSYSSVWNEVVEEMKFQESKYDLWWDTYLSFCKHLKLTTIDFKIPDFDKLQNQLYDTYKMFKYVLPRDMSIEDLTEYINQVGK